MAKNSIGFIRTVSVIFFVGLLPLTSACRVKTTPIGLCGESTPPPVASRTSERRRKPPKDYHANLGLAKRTALLDAVVCMGAYPISNPEEGAPPASPCSSGTLASPNRIVTAKHMNPEGGRVRFTFGDRPRWDPKGSVIGTRCWEFRHDHVKHTSRAAACCKHVFKPKPNAQPEEHAAYQQYLATCSDPLGDDEAVVSDLAVYDLAERVTHIKPIPVARKTPANDNNADHFKGEQGYLAGFGASENDAYTGLRRWGPTILNDAFETNWKDGDGDEVVLQFFSSSNDGDAASLGGDSGGPVFANYSGVPLAQRTCEDPNDWRIIGSIYMQGNGAHSMTFDEKTAPALEAFMDPDGDGIDVGFPDAHSPGAVDQDDDGFADSFVDSVTGATQPGQDNCPAVSNADQKDSNGDGVGDACT